MTLPNPTSMTSTTRPPAAVPDRATPHPTIARTLAGLVAVCLVPSLFALAWTVTLDYRAQERLLSNDVLARATSMRLSLDGDIATVEAGLQWLASSGDLASGDFGRFRDRLVDAKRQQSGSQVDPLLGYVLVDADGRVRVDTRPAPARSTARDDLGATLRPVFATGKALRASVAGDDAPSVIVLGVPVPRGDRTAFALAAVLAPDGLLATMHAATRSATAADLPKRWSAAIVEVDGRVLARTRDGPATLVPRTLGSGDAATVGETRTDGDVIVTAASRSARRGWAVVVGAPKAVLDAGLYRSIAILAAIVIVAFAIVLAFAVRVSRRVSRAVGGLVEPAIALGIGRLVDPPPTKLRETDAVGRALREASQRLATAQHHAYHDPLTNLRNRTLFDEMATRQITQAYRDGAQLAILAIDLDGFKAVNDLHGHAAGDAVLKTVADRVTGLLRGSDVVSRRGGDEFSVLLVDIDGARTRQVAEKILAVLSQPYADVTPSVSASIGVARYPRDATTLAALLEHADEALYAAKNAGKRRVVGDF